MRKKIKEQNDIERNIVISTIYECYMYDKNRGNIEILNQNVIWILQEYNVNKGSDLWKKTWKLYYDWIHFTNWRRKKNSRPPRKSKIESNIEQRLQIEEDLNDEFDGTLMEYPDGIDDSFDDLPF
tara:strand:+ start:3099 stop:3473 length:375 start_codon:yes stop_codon:yes gene_type:complete